MLVLSRKKGQAVIIQDSIEITVLEIDGDTIKLGISAPREMPIVRKELLLSVKESNLNAVADPADIAALSAQLKNLKK